MSTMNKNWVSFFMGEKIAMMSGRGGKRVNFGLVGKVRNLPPVLNINK